MGSVTTRARNSGSKTCLKGPANVTRAPWIKMRRSKPCYLAFVPGTCTHLTCQDRSEYHRGVLRTHFRRLHGLLGNRSHGPLWAE